MFDFLYDLPDWVMGLFVVGGLVSLSIGGFVLFRRMRPAEFSEEQKNVSLFIVGSVATINSLLLAFVAVAVWGAYADAENAVDNEATVAAELSRDLAVHGSAEAMHVRAMLKDYLQAVVDDEWTTMAKGGLSPGVWAKFDAMFHEAGRLEPDTPRREIVLREIWARINELTKQRRQRGYVAEGGIPSTLWLVVWLGTACTLSLSYVLTRGRFSYLMIGGLAASMGLILFFTAAMDRPFFGKNSISPDPMRSAIAQMEYWDHTFAPTAP